MCSELYVGKVWIKVYEFDDAHLYFLFIDGKKWSHKSIVSSLHDFGDLSASAVRIGDLALMRGQSFLYLYDYGDEWTFQISVAKILESDATLQSQYVKEQRGSEPDQYLDWS